MHSIVQFQIALLVHKLLQCELRLGKQVDFARGWSYHWESLCWNHQYHMEALTLRCIRPPQSQSGPNIFLKTSVKQIGSINLILNHSGNFFWEDFFGWSLEYFHVWKLSFLNFYQEKLSCNADILMSYCTKSPLLTRKTKFV